MQKSYHHSFCNNRLHWYWSKMREWVPPRLSLYLSLEYGKSSCETCIRTSLAMTAWTEAVLCQCVDIDETVKNIVTKYADFMSRCFTFIWTYRADSLASASFYSVLYTGQWQHDRHHQNHLSLSHCPFIVLHLSQLLFLCCNGIQLQFCFQWSLFNFFYTTLLATAYKTCRDLIHYYSHTKLPLWLILLPPA